MFDTLNLLRGSFVFVMTYKGKRMAKAWNTDDILWYNILSAYTWNTYDQNQINVFVCVGGGRSL